ncbi:glycosyltransferase family 2 protein [Arthrobacter sp. SDTb3-6]|uniref:glycosyltransferase family 2 protein n=1 Tax=Arthrobacter sp. SDTb3-6 TaxID=2713571 RepID=UPI00159CF3C5|nr:hypothetical protein [Arthrobacter sp. SDTb3-6]NVN00102.1 hypothetical protein [Arthrobacter sp. SDTb3-6]
MTADLDELKSGDIDRFLEAIDTRITRVIIVFRDVPASRAQYYDSVPGVVAVVHGPRASGSKARNLGLQRLSSMDISVEDYVAFPDDDCYYPNEFYPIFKQITKNYSIDLIVGSYGETPVADVSLQRLTKKTALFKGSTVTQFAKWGLVRKVGGFNEGLGVGSGNFNYGEDNDYCYRLLLASKKSVYSPSLRVWHLVSRETTGRNSKGYLTVSILNCDLYLLTCVILPSVFIGIARDLLSGNLRFDEFVKIRRATRIPNMIVARREGARSKTLLDLKA